MRFDFLKTPPPAIQPALDRAAHGMARASRLLEHYRAHPPVCPTCGMEWVTIGAHGATVVAICPGGHQWTLKSEDVVG